MKNFTFSVSREGEYIEQIGVRAHDTEDAFRMLVKAGYDPTTEQIGLISTQVTDE